MKKKSTQTETPHESVVAELKDATKRNLELSAELVSLKAHVNWQSAIISELRGDKRRDDETIHALALRVR